MILLTKGGQKSVGK